MLPYYLLFIYVALFTFFPTSNYLSYFLRIRIFFFAALIIVLALFSGFRGEGVDRDYSNYVSWMSALSDSPDIALRLKDPAFAFLYWTVSSLNLEYYFVFLIYAFLALFFTYKFFRITTLELFFVAFFFFFCRFYLVLDFTQIRIAVAVPMASLALHFVFHGRKNFGLVVFIIALLFHLSVIVYAPILIFLHFNKRFLSRSFLICFIFLGFIFGYFYGSTFLSFGGLDIPNYAAYLNGSVESQFLNILNKYILLKLSILIYLLIFWWHNFGLWEKLILNLVSLGLTLQFLFMGSDVIGWRLSELFCLFDVLMFLMPCRLLYGYFRAAYYIFIYLAMSLLYYSSLVVVGDYVMVF